MEKMKLLIAEGTDELRLALTDMLSGSYQLCHCGDGLRAKELLASFHPDVMILDLMLPGYDGISLLQWAVEQDHHPMVLATTRFLNEYVAEEIGRLGVGYVMLKPCDLKATAARLKDIGSRIHAPRVSRPDPQARANNLLLSLGVPTKLRGYAYLREAVLLCLQTPGQSVTKVLYPQVAKRCGCEAAHVERSIRTAIAAAWSRRNEQVWREYFQPDASGQIPRPTNAACITRLADALRDADALEN